MSLKTSALLLLVLLPVSVLAEPERVRLCTGELPPAAPAVDDGEGLRAYVDPNTGELLEGPTPVQQAERQSQEAQAKVAPQPPPQVSVAADGTRTVVLGERFMTELHAELVDGKIVTCHRPVSGLDGAPPEPGRDAKAAPVQPDETPDSSHR